MELRIETQKQTLTTRDESIRKLLEMLKGKGHAVQQFEDDRGQIERLNDRALHDERRIEKLEKLLEQRDKEISFLAEVCLTVRLLPCIYMIVHLSAMTVDNSTVTLWHEPVYDSMLVFAEYA